VTTTPDEVLDRLRNRMGSGMRHGMHGGGAASPLLGGDAGDVPYPHFLVNGRVATAPAGFVGKPRRRVRLRFLNAGAVTASRVALGGHRMTVTHTDAFPVEPAQTDALLLGMGERYDALVTLDDGVFPLVAVAEGKGAAAFAVVRTGTGSPPSPVIRPRELDGQVLRHADLRAAERVRLPVRRVDVEHRLALTGGMMGYNWGINGRRYDPSEPLVVEEGQRARLRFNNRTMMWFQTSGVRKDTVIVLPGATVSCDLQADNPGQWMIHCHNVYHAEAGMMTLLGYRA
jgi:FtsP/CotA-like multicopper oxidase with cupredoxin domain